MLSTFISPDEIRSQFSQAMSDMYKTEVPLYQDLLDMVSEINHKVLKEDPELAKQLAENDELSRLDVERHGAIRVGTPQELNTMRRLFKVMGMYPVGYYDLSVAGVPVHSTAFRPMDDQALKINPFRVFTSLLRLELIEDPSLRETASRVLAKRSIFTQRCLELIDLYEKNGGLTKDQANEFVKEALETFRWHQEATVDANLYQQLRKAHPLVADIVCFKGPHINHLTPRTLDIDQAQETMPKKGIRAKAVVEGPAVSNAPILLRQTSFLALNEPVLFPEANGEMTQGTHTARFGEIEQRGIALTQAGRQLYDDVLNRVRKEVTPSGDGSNKVEYVNVLNKHFAAYPSCYNELRKQKLAYFHYKANPKAKLTGDVNVHADHIEDLIAKGFISFYPITYEDFLPVSAAGIFQSNLGNENKAAYQLKSAQSIFEDALGSPVHNELALYEQAQTASLAQALADLQTRQ